MNVFKKIAITGGIGSGKSTVSDIVRECGYTVYDADKIYNDLLSSDDFLSEIYRVIGLAPKYNDGKIYFDRPYVSEAVFQDKEKLKKLNEFTHAEVFRYIEKICAAYIDEKPLFFEIQLLFESGKEDYFDNVWIVKRSLEDRVDSIKRRSGLSEEQIISRIKNQIDYDKIDVSEHTLIINDGDIDSLRKKVKNALEKIR